MVNANKVPKIDKVSSLVRACKKGKETIIIESLFYCALRNKELVLLKVGDFDLELRKVYIREETTKYRSKGFVPLNPIHAGHVREYIYEHELNEEDFLLNYGKQRKPYSTRRIRAIVKGISNRTALGNIYPHMLRHGCGYALVNRGVDVRRIQLLMGHARIESTVAYTLLDQRRLQGIWD